MQVPLQPMLFNILAKNKDVKANLSLEKLMQQASDVVRKGLADLEVSRGFWVTKDTFRKWIA